MKLVENITGHRKTLLKYRIVLHVFFRYLPRLFRLDLAPFGFLQTMRRLLHLVNKMDRNKYVRIGETSRINLYIPGYPSDAFFGACKKFECFEDKMPCLSVLISITSACPFSCRHCYQKLDKGTDLDLDILTRTVRKLQDQGIVFFNIEGGEPFQRYDRLLEVCRTIDNRSEIWLNSTGKGITLDRLNELKQTPVTAIMFSLRTADPKHYDELMGKEGAWEIASNGMKLCREAGIAVALNSCISKEDFFNGNFEKIMDKAKEIDASIIQIIHPKPAGGWLESGTDKFESDDLLAIERKIDKYNLSPQYRYYPSISAQIIEEGRNRFGCTAGGNDRFYINAKGDLQPCEFLNISYGNLKDEPFEEIYKRMRDSMSKYGTAWLCEKYAQKVYRIYKENSLSCLPLNHALSKEIYQNWDLGEDTPLYKRIQKLEIRG